MRMAERAVLRSIEGEAEPSREFIYEFQKAILLALVEDGSLNEAQYQYAAERLKAQFK